ncbi:hypothetical protein ACLOJK_017019, partial [Asimina triloba]
MNGRGRCTVVCCYGIYRSQLPRLEADDRACSAIFAANLASKSSDGARGTRGRHVEVSNCSSRRNLYHRALEALGPAAAPV